MKKTNKKAYEFGKNQKTTVNPLIDIIVIDPETQTITHKQINRSDWKHEFRQHIGNNWADAVHFPDLPGVMECDDFGFLRNPTPYAFEFDGVVVPSKAVVASSWNWTIQDFKPGMLNKMLDHLKNKIHWLGKVDRENYRPKRIYVK